MAMLNHARETNAIEESVLVERHVCRGVPCCCQSVLLHAAPDRQPLFQQKLQEKIPSAHQQPHRAVDQPQQGQHEGFLSRLDAACPRSLSKLHPFGRGGSAADHGHFPDAGTEVAPQHHCVAQGRRAVNLGAL
ncbi:hypothetical protein KL921_005102 [Ogataea angusta]|nr:hypothetical protein KL921_005102 [Ogataea angusta]